MPEVVVEDREIPFEAVAPLAALFDVVDQGRCFHWKWLPSKQLLAVMLGVVAVVVVETVVIEIVAIGVVVAVD